MYMLGYVQELINGEVRKGEKRMIKKIEGTENGYLLDDTSDRDDWKYIQKSYGKNFRCLICNVKQ